MQKENWLEHRTFSASLRHTLLINCIPRVCKDKHIWTEPYRNSYATDHNSKLCLVYGICLRQYFSIESGKIMTSFDEYVLENATSESSIAMTWMVTMNDSIASATTRATTTVANVIVSTTNAATTSTYTSLSSWLTTSRIQIILYITICNATLLLCTINCISDKNFVILNSAACDSRKCIGYFDVDSKSSNANHHQCVSVESSHLRHSSGRSLHANYLDWNTAAWLYVRWSDVQTIAVFAR